MSIRIRERNTSLGLFHFFRDISERNNDYSDTLGFKRGGGGGGHVFRFGGPWLRIRNVNIHMWVVLQKLPQFSDTHFSQVLNKLEKICFMVLQNIISLSISSKLYKFPPPQTTTA